MKVLLVAGARPNFMKIAPVYRAARGLSDVDCRIVHTGQHYDYEMIENHGIELPSAVTPLKPLGFLEALFLLSQDLQSKAGPPLWDGKAAERIWQAILRHEQTAGV